MLSNFTPNFGSNFQPSGGFDDIMLGGDNIYPTLDAFFAHDKAFTVDEANPGGCLITSRLGPDAKFSRASGRTFTDSDGLVKWAAENLLLQSENISSSPWGSSSGVITGGFADPDGGNSAFKFTPAVADDFVRQLVLVNAGTAYTFAVWLRSSTGSNVSTELRLYASMNAAEVIELTPEWQQFDVSGVATLTDYVHLLIGGFSSLSTGENIEIYHPQFSRTPCQYLHTTSAPVYGPAFEHDPVTGVCKGLLIEEQRMNYLLNSSDLTGAGWNFSVIPSYIPLIGTTTGVKPDGITGSISTISYPVVNGAAHSFVYQLATTPLQGNVSESLWVRVASGTATIYANIIDNAATPAGSNFIAGNPEVVTTEWRRISIAGNVSGGSNAVFSIGFDQRCDPAQINPTAFTLEVWGAQLEQASSPSSYIPTTTAAVVRSADVEDGDSTALAAEGTIVVTSTNRGVPVLFDLSDGSVNNRIQVYMAGTTMHLVVTRAGVQTMTSAIGTLAVDDTSKIAVTWDGTNIAWCVDGGAVSTVAALPPVAIGTLYVGGNSAGAVGCSVTGRGMVYQKPLSSTKIQSLTA